MLNVNQNHPLIQREQTFFLDRKLISFHSYDRDIKKWPQANHFEIILPEGLKNVQSIRLDTISIPSNQHVFNNEYQNTKLSFSLDPYSSTQNVLSIIIDEGTYSPIELALEIQTKMNNAVSASYDGFRIKYNKISNTLWFGNIQQSFVLRFDIEHKYDNICNGQKVVFNQYTKWGLPAYLGYKKAIYTSTSTPSGGSEYGFDYEYPTKWLDNNLNQNNFIDINNLEPPSFLSEEEKKLWPEKNAVCNIDIYGDDIIYMEIDKYNSMDEIAPYSESTTTVFNNDYHGKTNSAFAKIPISIKPYNSVVESKHINIMNASFYEPPLEKLRRLKFKFRYHDDRLVDFKCAPFSFTLEFNMLRDEQLRTRNVRIAGLYN